MSRQERDRIKMEDKQCGRVKIATVVLVTGWLLITLICYLTGGV